MKIAFFIATLASLVVSIASAQPQIEWQNALGGNGSDNLQDGILTYDGSYLLFGSSNTNINGNKTESSNGGLDYWVMKIDQSGNIIWQNTIGGLVNETATSCIQTADSGYLLAGYSLSGISGDKTEASQGGHDYWIVKLDSLGVVQWDKTIGGNTDDFLMSAIQTPDGGYFIGGQSDSGISGDKTEASNGLIDFWVLKLDAQGNIQWQNTIGGAGNDALQSIALTQDSCYLLGGSSNSGISGDKSEVSQGVSDFWVVKIDTLGNIMWQNTIGGSSTDGIYDVAATSDGGFALAGFSSSNISGDKTEASNGSVDYWIVKINSLGNILWQNTIGAPQSDEARTIEQTNDGGFIICGNSNSGIGGDKTEPNWAAGAPTDFWVVRLDASGGLLWENTVGGTATERTAFCFQTVDEGYLFGGRSSSGLNGDKTEASLGNTDYWVIKLTCDGTDSDSDGYCTNTDCNDGDPLVNPGMTEIECNGIDDDCNPLTLDDDVTDPITPTLIAITSECTITAPIPTTTDACAGTINGTTTDPLTYSIEGTYTINWTFDDGSGNSILVPQSVIIDDVTNPVVPVLADSIGQCFASVPVPTTTDNCGGTITGTTSFPLSYSAQGQYIVYWTFDDGNGNFIVTPQTVIVDDTTDPDTPILPDLIGECSITAVAPITSDNCSGAITGVTSDPLTYSSQGNYTINWTFDDGNGNSIVVPQNVIVNDVTAPDIPVLSNLLGECSLTASVPTTTDNCAGSISGITSDPVSYSNQGNFVINWTFDDGNGNSIIIPQNVIIDDQTAPVAPTISDFLAGCSTTPTVPTANDACTGTINGTTSTPFPLNTQGTTVVTWSFDDGNGNVITVDQNIIIDDVTAPIPDLSSLPDISEECSVNALIPPTATDNCVSTVNVSSDATFPITTNTLVTWTFDDNNGNIASQTQNVIITPIDVSTSIVVLNDTLQQIVANSAGYNYQWIENCGSTNDAIIGETSMDFAPLSSGSYSVILSNAICVDTTECVTIDYSGPQPPEGYEIFVYPNPTSDIVTVLFNEVFENIAVDVINPLGQIVRKQTFIDSDEIEISLGNSPGVYFVRVTYGDREVTLPVVKL